MISMDHCAIFNTVLHLKLKQGMKPQWARIQQRRRLLEEDVIINKFANCMNAKVRRYEPLFLSPQMRLLPRSPTKPASSWKDKVNHEVTLTYNRIKNNESKCSLPENNDLQQIRSVNSAIADCGARSCSTQSNTETPIKPKLELYNYQTISTTLYKTDREKEIENYYSHRVQLLEEECNYLRKEFIGHCLRHHRRQFERLSLH